MFLILKGVPSRAGCAQFRALHPSNLDFSISFCRILSKSALISVQTSKITTQKPWWENNGFKFGFGSFSCISATVEIISKKLNKTTGYVRSWAKRILNL